VTSRSSHTHRPQVRLDLDGRATQLGGLTGTEDGHGNLAEGGGHGEGGHRALLLRCHEGRGKRFFLFLSKKFPKAFLLFGSSKGIRKRFPAIARYALYYCLPKKQKTSILSKYPN
jgi:hypothetical protein